MSVIRLGVRVRVGLSADIARQIYLLGPELKHNI